MSSCILFSCMGYLSAELHMLHYNLALRRLKNELSIYSDELCNGDDL